MFSGDRPGCTSELKTEEPKGHKRKTGNEERKGQLHLARRAVPPLPRGSGSRGSSPNVESFELKIGNIVEESISRELQKSQPQQAAGPIARSSASGHAQLQPTSVTAAGRALDKEIREHELSRPTLDSVYGQWDEHGYYGDTHYDSWFTGGHQPEPGTRQSAMPSNVTAREGHRARSPSPSVTLLDSSSKRRVKQESALAREQADLKRAQVKQPPALPSDDIKALVDIKHLRVMATVLVPEGAKEFRAWKMGILHGMTAYDSTGGMRNYLSAAMSIRGEAQTKLKFKEHPMNQAMEVLGSKFMNQQNFQHPQFGPMLEIYSSECLQHSCSPTAPYIVSCIAAWYDTSSGGTVTERDLYAIKCSGKPLQHLSDFVAQVEYVVPHIEPGTLPHERTLFDWFYKEVQESSSIKRIIEKIRDVDSDSEEEAKVKTWSYLRNSMDKELRHLQVQKNDAATKTVK